MRKDLIEKTEAEHLEQCVNEWIALKGQDIEDVTLTKYVTDKTAELIYFIPSALFFLEREYCAEFYLAQCDKIPEFIYSYRICKKTSYVDYLINLCRLRCFAFNQRRLYKEGTEVCIAYSEFQESEGRYYTTKEPAEMAKIAPTKTLSESYERILEAAQKEPCGAAKSYMIPSEVKEFLRSSKNRSKFLVYIMSCCDYLPEVMQSNLAVAFSVKRELFADLSTNMYALSRERGGEKEEENQRLLAKSWIRYLTLTKSIVTASDEETKKELRYQQKKALERVRNHQKNKERNKGLSYRKMASCLDMAPGTVCRYVKETRAFLYDLVQ